MFHGVIGLFVLAALISVMPTLRFMRWRKAVDAGALPAGAEVRKTRMLVHVELGLIFIVALLITMVAKGYGGHCVTEPFTAHRAARTGPPQEKQGLNMLDSTKHQKHNTQTAQT